MEREDDMAEPALDRLAVAAALREIGVLLGLERGNQFRSRAFARGARALERFGGDLDALVRRKALTTIPDVGERIAAAVTELLSTGRSEQLERLRRRHPPGAAALAAVLSPPRIRVVHEALGITSLDALRAACSDGRLRDLPGFGARTAERIAGRIDALARLETGMLLPEADARAIDVLAHLRRHRDVVRAEIAGELRRRSELVHGLDVVVATAAPKAVLAHAATLPASGDVRVHVASPPRFAARWIEATATEGHVEALARRATERGLVLHDLPALDESAVYGALDLPFIPPELREDAGEIDAAAAGTLPARLLQLADLRGAIHCHTVWSDGRHTIEQMARAADAMGLAYLTITDHSQRATYAGGLDVDGLRRQWDEIAAVQERVRVRLLRGTESDILRDGALDFPDAILGQLDVVIASIHERHHMDADEMTERLVRALRHPVFKIWGHALGRYVQSRPPVACDVRRVLDVAATSRVAIEVNGDPRRLDLAPPWIREARMRGIPFVVSSDAHSTQGLANARFGVDMARRGWLRPDDVLNTRDVEAFAAAVRP